MILDTRGQFVGSLAVICGKISFEMSVLLSSLSVEVWRAPLTQIRLAEERGYTKATAPTVIMNFGALWWLPSSRHSL
jgi:hypothetical protein